MRCASVDGSRKKPMRTRLAGLTKFSLLGISGGESHLTRRLFASMLGRIARLFLLEGSLKLWQPENRSRATRDGSGV